MLVDDAKARMSQGLSPHEPGDRPVFEVFLYSMRLV